MKKRKKGKTQGKILSAANRIWSKARELLGHPIKIFNRFCYYLGVLVFTSALAIILLTYSMFQSLPEVSNLSFDEIKQIAEEKTRDNLLDKSKKYRWVSIDNVSRQYLYAVVMSEDSSFFQHDGINYDAILRSLLVNLKAKSFKAGGSTISQQVVKNIFLTQEKTITRKFKEYFITKELERSFTKNQILELYLNIIEAGPDIYGVNAASHIYFSKRPSELNGAEGAFVAIMLPSPRKYHHSIYANKYIGKRHRKKLNRILGDMKHYEYISPKQFKKYMQYPYFETH